MAEDIWTSGFARKTQYGAYCLVYDFNKSMDMIKLYLNFREHSWRLFLLTSRYQFFKMSKCGWSKPLKQPSHLVSHCYFSDLMKIHPSSS